MGSLPLHPALVHLPLGLAILMPLLATGLALAARRREMGRAPWLALLALQALLSVSAVVALKTGQRDEDLAEKVVPKAAIHEHEEAAEGFLVATFVVLALGAAGAFLPGRLASAGRGLFVLGTLAVVGLGLRAGHLGGQLVYVHGAASAHVQKAGGAGATAPAATTAPSEKDDDDDHHR